MNRYERSNHNKEQVTELRKAYPEMTLESIGQRVSLTKERVRQILVEAELPTLSKGRITTKIKASEPCEYCGNLEKTFKKKHSKFCSRRCMTLAREHQWTQWRKDHPDRQTTYNCEYCGKAKTIRTTLYKRQDLIGKHFCSHACAIAGQWADKESNMNHRKPRQKYDVQLELGIDSTNNI